MPKAAPLTYTALWQLRRPGDGSGRDAEFPPIEVWLKYSRGGDKAGESCLLPTLASD